MSRSIMIEFGQMAGFSQHQENLRQQILTPAQKPAALPRLKVSVANVRMLPAVKITLPPLSVGTSLRHSLTSRTLLSLPAGQKPMPFRTFLHLLTLGRTILSTPQGGHRE